MGQIAEGIFCGLPVRLVKTLAGSRCYAQPFDENGVQQSPGWSRAFGILLIKERHVKAGHETFDTDAGIPAKSYGFLSMNTTSWNKISTKLKS